MILFLEFMAKWAIWDMIAVAIAILPFFAVVWYLWPKKSMPDVYIDAIAQNGPNEVYPRVIQIKIRNHSNNAVYIQSLGFQFAGTIGPNPEGAKDHNTGLYEVKFEGQTQEQLSDIDTLVRAKQEIQTWIPVDPSITNFDLAKAIKQKEVGSLKLKCMIISSKPSRLFNVDINV